MNKYIQKIAAGVLAAGLVLGCGGCGNLQEVSHNTPTIPSPTNPTVVNDPVTTVTPGEGPVSPHLLQLANLTAAPEYPEMPQCPRQEDYPEGSQQFYEDQSKWHQERQLYYAASPKNAHEVDGFLQTAMDTFLSGEGNRVCSPLNIYFALAMLAETTEGSSRQQVLQVLGQNSLKELREQANQLWRAHYINDGQTTSLLANSVWLDEEYAFKDAALADLAKYHYTSVFNGDLGTGEMDEQLAAWLDSQTGGLLTDYTEGIKLDPLTVFCLASTAYFRGDWEDSFPESQTRPEIFHCSDKELETEFMHQTAMSQRYCTGDGFSAVQLGLSGGHSMWLILPQVGSSPEAVLEQGDYYKMISDPDSWKKQERVTLHLGMPKFDVSGKQDLIPGLKAMGITDVCNEALADFSPMTDEPLVLGRADHAARVAVDEEGVVAAAYTLMLAYATGAPVEDEVEFTLDRPFLFAITGEDHLPLFAGVVAEP